jgi:hypothetical protein
MRRSTAVDAPATMGVMSIRELLSEEEEVDIEKLRACKSELEEITSAFQNALADLDYSTENMDREIKSFDILDAFFNDPQGLDNIQGYINSLNDMISGEPLNAVTSSIALSASGIMEALREIKARNPGFTLQHTQIQDYIDHTNAETGTLQAQLLIEEAQAELSEEVRNLALTADEAQVKLMEGVDFYRKNEILRGRHVRRALDNCLSLGIQDLVANASLREKEEAVRNLMDFALGCVGEQYH